MAVENARASSERMTHGKKPHANNNALKPEEQGAEMKTFLAAAALASIVAINGATAADMPAKAPVAAPSYSYDWSGFYLGLNAGAAIDPAHFKTSTVHSDIGYFEDTAVGPIADAGDRKVRTPGFTGGIQAGYDWQISNTVLGIEADFNYMGVKGSAVSSAVYPENAPDSFTVKQSLKTDWLLTVRPRVGWAANNWLFYVTGGLALTRIKGAFIFADTIGASESASMSRTRAGWALGGGVEYRISGPWSLKIEYLRVDFGSVSTTSTNLSLDEVKYPSNPFTHSIRLSDDIVRVGLNYRFHP
jgi:outer membrane immunogenic protein